VEEDLIYKATAALTQPKPEKLLNFKPTIRLEEGLTELANGLEPRTGVT